MKGKFTAILLAVLMIASCLLTACSDEDGSGHTFRYTLLSDPQNLDPQMAEDLSSLNVISNIYTGLLRQTQTGGIECDACESYTVSADGLVYNFKIKEGIKWQTNAEFEADMTAHDFVYGFKRLLSPNTGSPHAKNFYCIKNAQAINTMGAPLDTLGVEALSDYELRIELSSANSDFLYLLTTPPSFPCNEEFFYFTKGKYGLNTNAVASNGPFYITSWLYDPYGKDNYLILRRNASYNDINTVYPYAINYFIQRNNPEKKLYDFTEGETDVVDYIGTDEDYLNEFAYKSYQTMSVGLVFNLENECMQYDEVRQALAMSLDMSVFEDLPRSLKKATGLIPSEVSILNKSFRELYAQPSAEEYNLSLAQLLWQSNLTLKERSSLDGTNILVPQSFEYFDILNDVVSQWQTGLQFYCGVEVVPDDEYEKRISEGKFVVALSYNTADENLPQRFFDNYVYGGLYRYQIAELNQIITAAKLEYSLSKCASYYSQAEKYMIDKNYYIPLFYQSEYLLIGEDITDVEYNPFTKCIKFEKAKCFD